MASAVEENKKLSMLVVDDEQNSVDFIKRALRSSYEVHVALSGAAAIECMQSHHDIDAVVTDQRMPGISGVEVLRFAHDEVPHAARIIVTGYTEFEDILQAINEGRVNHVLVKPFQSGAAPLQRRSFDDSKMAA